MFEEFQGIPLHPLLIHAAVVFVPLLCLVALLYALLPFSRLHLRWSLFALALIAPGAALFSKLSGTALAERLQSRGRVSAEYVPKIAEHQDFGDKTFYVTSALGVIALLLWWFVRPRRDGERASFDFLNILLAIVTVLAAAAAAYYVIRTGDSGAKMVWNGQ